MQTRLADGTHGGGRFLAIPVLNIPTQRMCNGNP